MEFLEFLHEIDYFDLFSNALMITSFVIIMMTLIEYVNVLTNGKFIKSLNKNIFVQALIGTVLGVLPGCLGSFTAVSLYTHKALSLGALVACFIATSGDEAFVMLATMPVQSLWIFGISAAIAFATSLIVDKLFKNKHFKNQASDCISFDVHEEEQEQGKFFAFKNLSASRSRLKLIAVFVAIIFLSSIGVIGHSHSENLIFSLPQQDNAEMQTVDNHACCDHEHHHESDCQHSEFHHHHDHSSLDIVNIIIITLSIIMLIIILFSNEHFIDEHLVNHVIQKHLPRIFWWTFGVLIFMAIILNYTNFGDWIYDNTYFLLLIAVLVGILPESGPHLIFVVLFVQGYIPLSILLANSIVQDGHGSLPLLAESKKAFFVTKGVNVLVGLAVGLIGLIFF